MDNNTSLKQIVERVNDRLITNKQPFVEEEVLAILENQIELAYPILERLLTENIEKNSVNLTQQSCLLLICEIIAYVQYAIEQDRDWAKQFAYDFQAYIAKNVFKPEVSAEIIHSLLDILHQTEITIIEPIRQANANLLENAAYKEDIGPENIAELLKEIAQFGANNEYAMYEHLISQTYQIVPIEIQMIMIMEMVSSNIETVNNTAVLMLMHPEPMIRDRVGSILLDAIEKITPTSLRRLIIMRNWLPADERVGIDILIRNARLKNIVCEPWPKARIMKLLATGFDGMGSQSIISLSKQNSEYYLTGILLKENIGIREPLLFHSEKRIQAEKLMRDMTNTSGFIPISPLYLDIAIPNFLAITSENGNAPSPWLLNFAEVVGSSHWRAESIDEKATLNQLLRECGNTALDKDSLDRVFSKSKTWLRQKDFADSWFEQDAHVDKMIEEILQTINSNENIEMNALIEQVCTKILEPRRLKWRDRLLWMAIWAKSNTRKKGANWHEFAVLAKALDEGQPLEEIPLMQSISAETALAAASYMLPQD